VRLPAGIGRQIPSATANVVPDASHRFEGRELDSLHLWDRRAVQGKEVTLSIRLFVKSRTTRSGGGIHIEVNEHDAIPNYLFYLDVVRSNSKCSADHRSRPQSCQSGGIDQNCYHFWWLGRAYAKAIRQIG